MSGQETNYTHEIYLKDEKQKGHVCQGHLKKEGEPAMFGQKDEHPMSWEHQGQRSRKEHDVSV